MPLDGESLVVEPRYPNAKALMAMCGKPEEPEDSEYSGAVLVNSFYSDRRRCEVQIYRLRDGRTEWGIRPAIHHFEMDLHTLGCADAWGIEQETNAMVLLRSLLNDRQWKHYLLTGTFLETSKRSRVTYLFRRLKPTVAIRAVGAQTRIMCALCMHPIAYYSGTWAGAMCPSDDVAAHLSLMRGDEAMFWRRSTQHPSWRPEAGL